MNRTSVTLDAFKGKPLWDVDIREEDEEHCDGVLLFADGTAFALFDNFEGVDAPWPDDVSIDVEGDASALVGVKFLGVSSLNPAVTHSPITGADGERSTLTVALITDPPVDYTLHFRRDGRPETLVHALEARPVEFVR